MKTIRTIGILIMLSGLALKLADLPGATVAFITGAALILLARISQWMGQSKQNS